MSIRQTILVILDGFGHNTVAEGNAILSTPTPNLDSLWNNYQHTLLKAAEEEVGLSFGEMGNSEVGHLSIGTGRVLYQSLPRINQAIENQTFFQNQAFLKAVEHVKQSKGSLHISGMISVAGVHAHLDHMLALLKFASQQKLKKVFLHLILDGRDSGPKDAPTYIQKISEGIAEYKTGTIASLTGRAIAMDRNNNWERTQTFLNVLLGNTTNKGTDPIQIVQQNYQQGGDDENQPGTIITDNKGNPQGILSEGDAFVFTNFREDRARQIAQLLTQTPPAPQVNLPSNLLIATMTQYDKNIKGVLTAFPPEHPTSTLSDVLFSSGIPQIHISETEKYAHVTYFFNGGRETPHPTEKFFQVPSPKPETFIPHPEMAANQVATAAIDAINKNWPFIIVNFANPDMIAHTGNFTATKAAIALVDTLVGNISKVITQKGGNLFLTADHGNSESMIDPSTHTATKDHTSSPVPFIAATPELRLQNPTNTRITLDAQVTGLLADVAPTILHSLNLPIPQEMTGTPLF